jgi:hypothetical protein
MAVAIIIDPVDESYSFTEEMGAAASFTRTCHITGLTAGSGTPLAARIAEAETAMDTNFAYFATTSVDTNLRVVSREFSNWGEETSKMKCVVTYAARKDVLGPVGTWTPSFNGTLSQVQTAKDINGFPAFTAHTFPSTDDNHPSQTITQGGRVPQQRPMIEVTYTGLIKPASIVLEKIKYLGKLNNATWLYGNMGRWMCTGFNAVVHDTATTPATYLVDVTFQADGFDWNPVLVFTDPATGQQPDNLVNGVGIKTIYTQNYVDFNDLIPTS